jgi:CHASE3 domain sensor protein
MVTAFWLLVSMTFFVNFKNLESSHELRIHTYDVISNTKEVLNNIAEAEACNRNYVIIGKPEYLACFETAKNKILPAIDKIKKLTATNKEQQKRLGAAVDIAKYRLDIWDQTIVEYKKSGFDAAKKCIAENYHTCGIVKMNELRQTMSDVEAAEIALLSIHEQKNNTDFSNAKHCIYAAFVISIVMLSIPAFNFIRKQWRP